MKYSRIPRAILVLSLGCGLIAGFAGCGGGGSDDPPPPVVKQWTIAAVLDDTQSNAAYPVVVSDTSGKSLTVWREITNVDTGSQNYFSKTFSGSSWGATQAVSSGDTNAVNTRTLSANSGGDFLSLWRQDDNAGNVHFTWNKNDATAWATPASLEDLQGGAIEIGGGVTIDSDGSGNTVAVWVHADGDGQNLWSSTYSAGTWSAPGVLIDCGNFACYDPHLDLHKSGKAVLVWKQDTDTGYAVYASAYQDSTWEAPLMINDPLDLDAYSPSVAINNADEAVIAWGQWDGSLDTVWTRVYTLGSGLDADPLQMDTQPSSLEHRKCVAANDKAYVVWHKYDDGEGLESIWASSYQGGVWSTAKRLNVSGVDAEEALDPIVVMDTDDNAFVLWRQIGDARSLYTAKADADGTWSASTQLNSGTPTNFFGYDLSVDKNNKIVAVWSQSDAGVTKIWSSVYK